MDRLSIGLSFLSALSALIVARFVIGARPVKFVGNSIDFGSIDPAIFPVSFRQRLLGAIKVSGDLNCKAASWAAISAS